VRRCLTERGRAAATIIRSVVERVDADLAARVGAEYVAHTRATLAALIEGNYGAPEHDRG
jgi:hypothetical protein